jgi:hypothetical protein
VPIPVKTPEDAGKTARVVHLVFGDTIAFVLRALIERLERVGFMLSRSLRRLGFRRRRQPRTWLPRHTESPDLPLELDKGVDALADRVATVFEEADLGRLERSVELEDESGVFGALGVAPAEWHTLVDRAEHLANEHRTELRRGHVTGDV